MILLLINAVPYVDQITFAAYLESEQKETELWKHRKEGAYDWSCIFQTCSQQNGAYSYIYFWRYLLV